MEKITASQLEEMLNEALDQAEALEVAGFSYTPSQVLKSVDPTAYRLSLHDYADSLTREGYEVEGYE